MKSLLEAVLSAINFNIYYRNYVYAMVGSNDQDNLGPVYNISDIVLVSF